MHVVAVLLSLVQPGAGHALIGRWRAGLAWAIGLPVLGLAWLLALSSLAPFSLTAWVATLALAIASYLGMAADAARRPLVAMSWGRRVLMLGGLILVNLAVSVLVASPVATYVRTYRVQAFTIPSGNMIPTLLVGDYVLTDKAVYRSRPPQRGDIVVFKYPVDERRDFVKRIVGLPGEQIQVRGREVLVNGAPLDEPYVHPPAFPAPRAGPADVCGYAYGCTPIVVPSDAYFVMGDNRDNSQDSRYWGFVRREKIVGRVAMVYWSWDSDRHWLRTGRLGHRL